jgi:hypothetical protein
MPAMHPTMKRLFILAQTRFPIDGPATREDRKAWITSEMLRLHPEMDADEASRLFEETTTPATVHLTVGPDGVLRQSEQ